jgi:hypothetical protein
MPKLRPYVPLTSEQKLLTNFHRMERRIDARFDALEAALHRGESRPLVPGDGGPKVYNDSAGEPRPKSEKRR